ncbi:MAG: sulfonate transport system substrate-binding protein [Paracoccaceae bacterium]|jgi:sulfonate transport system substrate-binding protein
MTSRNSLTRKIIPGLAAAVAAVTVSLTAGAEPVKIRIQWSVAPAHITPLIPLAPKGIYKNYGKSYVVEPVRMRGSGPALQGIAAGEIDLGGMSIQALVRGVKRAKLDLKVIGQVMSGGVDGYGSSEFYARDGEITKLEDLKGKIIAVNALGSSIDAAVQAQFGRLGWKVGRDYQVVEVRFSAMLPALQSKRVDLAPLLTPFNLIAKKKGGVKYMFNMRDALGATETLQWIGRADWVKKNRAALVDFMADHIRFRTWLYDPKSREEVLATLSKVTKRPAKNYASWAFTKTDNYREPNALVNVARMQKNVDDLVRLGVLKESIAVKNYIDLSIAQEAAARANK